MLISTKGRYALRVMLELAQGEPGECMPLPVIAQRQGISEKYLESIIAVLARAGRCSPPPDRKRAQASPPSAGRSRRPNNPSAPG